MDLPRGIRGCSIGHTDPSQRETLSLGLVRSSLESCCPFDESGRPCLRAHELISGPPRKRALGLSKTLSSECLLYCPSCRLLLLIVLISGKSGRSRKMLKLTRADWAPEKKTVSSRLVHCPSKYLKSRITLMVMVPAEVVVKSTKEH